MQFHHIIDPETAGIDREHERIGVGIASAGGRDEIDLGPQAIGEGLAVAGDRLGLHFRQRHDLGTGGGIAHQGDELVGDHVRVAHRRLAGPVALHVPREHAKLVGRRGGRGQSHTSGQPKHGSQHDRLLRENTGTTARVRYPDATEMSVYSADLVR